MVTPDLGVTSPRLPSMHKVARNVSESCSVELWQRSHAPDMPGSRYGSPQPNGGRGEGDSPLLVLRTHMLRFHGCHTQTFRQATQYLNILQVEARLHMFEEESSASACGQLAEDVYGPMSGQVTSVARQAFRRAVLEGDPRLVEAMFLCEVSTTAEALSGEIIHDTHEFG